jgi:hypothetical protein
MSHTSFVSENLKWKDNLKDLIVDGRMMANWRDYMSLIQLDESNAVVTSRIA